MAVGANESAIGAKESAIEAQSAAREMRRNVTYVGIAAAVAAIVSLIAVYVQMHGIIHDAHALNQSVLGGLTSAVTDAKLLSDKVQSLEQKLKDAESEARERRSVQERLTDQIMALRGQLGILQTTVQTIQNQPKK
jgi:hypothetical protein